MNLYTLKTNLKDIFRLLEAFLIAASLREPDQFTSPNMPDPQI